MSEGATVAIVVRTHDRSRVADVELPLGMTVGELLETCQERWKLPQDRDYSVHSERLGRQLAANEALRAARIPAGDELVVYPLLEAGSRAAGDSAAGLVRSLRMKARP